MAFSATLRAAPVVTDAAAKTQGQGLRRFRKGHPATAPLKLRFRARPAGNSTVRGRVVVCGSFGGSPASKQGEQAAQDEVISANAIRFKDTQKVVSKDDDDVEGQLQDQLLDLKEGDTLSITVVGGSGDLARKKIFPALFSLFYQGYLPKHFTIFGYARSKMTSEEFRSKILERLGCRIDLHQSNEDCEEIMQRFLSRVFYQPGAYDEVDGYRNLHNALKTEEAGYQRANRLFYLSIPPSIFVDAAKGTSIGATSETGWTRVIVEKPFGRDAESSAKLGSDLAKYFEEEQIYRIDHYLGKELVDNLMVLRFSNLIFEPLWSRQHIRSVQIIFSEDFGTEGRGGYFDNYGIIRDIMQNHLLQVLALFAMEVPASLDADDVRDEKVKVLRSMETISLDHVVVGQYRAANGNPGYLDDETVPTGSICPTFAATTLFVNNARWDGVPFLMKAGKALDKRRAEIRVQFRHVPGSIYKDAFGGKANLEMATNELVIRVQPDEAIYLKINNKIPGLGLQLDRTTLDLSYKSTFSSNQIPDAYERLILDAINGDKRLFIRDDELREAWRIFTPLLKKLEEQKVAPELYPYGSQGPVGAYYLASKYNARWADQ